MRTGFYKLCRATQTGDADDSFVDSAHPQMTQAGTQHLIGWLPWLANMETDISERLLPQPTRLPSELYNISKEIKEKAAKAERTQISNVLFHFGSTEFCLCGGWGEVLCGLGAPTCVLRGGP